MVFQLVNDLKMHLLILIIKIPDDGDQVKKQSSETLIESNKLYTVKNVSD
jgi:hypothetical protein